MISSRRRWLFGLRTLFVVLTLSTFPFMWLRAQWSFVRERQQAQREIAAKGGAVYVTHPGDVTGVILQRYQWVMPRPPVPWARRIVGDLPVMAITLAWEQSDSATVARFKKLFPEADILRCDDWLGPPPYESDEANADFAD